MPRKNTIRATNVSSAEASTRADARRYLDVWISIALFTAVLAIYGQVWNHDFVSYDDPIYVTENVHVRAGITWDGIGWAFTSGYGANWFPLTWLSHMLDCQLFGLNSGWHHLTNVWIHALSTVFLFLVLLRMTGARWKNALVAFLFALHPLHVESVAWVAERKDVLSALFWMLALWSYIAYAAKPSRIRYVLALFVFCLGLMAKPMLVTLPVVLLLLDYWPLRRKFLVQKLPFFAAALAASMITLVVHQKGGTIASLELVPLGARVENALISYAVYILKMFWPTHLAVFYPFSLQGMLWPAVGSAIVLIAITLLAIHWRRKRPYLAVGWGWYLATVLPVIGLIQTGEQSRADRYTYIPMIGLTIVLVWGLAELLQPWPRVKVALAVSACGMCAVLTWFQVQYWEDSIALYQHAINAVPDSYEARFNLASALEARGETDAAITQLRETVRIRPAYVPARAELGQLLAKQGDVNDGIEELQTAVKMRPSDADAHFRLGSVYGSARRMADAASEFSMVVRLQPENADAHYNLALALSQENKFEEAAREFNETVRLRPHDPEAHFNLGVALASVGQIDKAVAEFSEAMRIRPDFPEAQQALEQAMSLRQSGGNQ